MQFARDHPHITVVGLGAGSAVNGDTLDGAFEFVRRHGLTAPNVTMIYDASFRAWREFAIVNQPWSIGYDASGTQIFREGGRVDLDAVGRVLS